MSRLITLHELTREHVREVEMRESGPAPWSMDDDDCDDRRDERRDRELTRDEVEGTDSMMGWEHDYSADEIVESP